MVLAAHPWQKAAQTLTSAQTPLFSAGDMMPTAMQTAFHKAGLNDVQNPGQLDSILASLDQERQTAYGASSSGSADETPAPASLGLTGTFAGI
jgi:hypothetical protein